MRATLLLAATLALAGASFDSPSLYVPAIGLALVAAGVAAWVRLAARGAAAERLPGAWSVVEGEPYRLALRLRRGRIPVPGGSVVDPLLDRPLALEGRFGGRIEGQTLFERRGRHALPAVTLRIGDPFGLRVAAVRSPEEGEVLVLPRVEPVVVPLRSGGLSQQGGDGGSRGNESGLDAEAVDFEIDGLRPYRPGTPASRIHWRSAARSMELIEHRLASGGGSNPLVVLDAHAPEDLESLDRAVRAAASLCLHLARRGGCMLMLPGESRPRRLDRTLRAWPDLHARLALVEKRRRPPALRRGGLGAVYWVTAAPNPEAAVLRSGFADGYLVTPGEARTGDAFSVSGCRGRTLRQAVRRGAETRAA
jgi:uncharacterized protein (DUF58 family)